MSFEGLQSLCHMSLIYSVGLASVRTFITVHLLLQASASSANPAQKLHNSQSCPDSTLQLMLCKSPRLVAVRLGRLALSYLPNKGDYSAISAAGTLPRLHSVAHTAGPPPIQALRRSRALGRHSIVAAMVSLGGLVRSLELISAVGPLQTSRLEAPRHVFQEEAEHHAAVFLMRQPVPSLSGARLWTEGHPWGTAAAAAPLLYIVWWFLLRFVILTIVPLRVLAWNEALSAPGDGLDVELGISGSKVKLPLRALLKSATLISRYHYHPRVLEAWVEKRIEAARMRFHNSLTVEARKTFVPLPAILNRIRLSTLTPADLHETTARDRWCIFIKGEGGLGKTTLACQLGLWAMADQPEKRLCQDRRLLPILVEADVEFDVRGEIRTFKRELRGKLQQIVGAKDPVSEGLFEQLLRDRRLLVVLDGLSEMPSGLPGADRARPGNPDFLVSSLVVTSRDDEDLSQDLTIEPLRIDSTHLLGFINSYLTEEGLTQLPDSDLFEASRRLADLVTMETGITPLLARLFAEQIVDLKKRSEHIRRLPTSVPDLMLAYLNSLNRDRAEHDPDDPTVHRAAKIAAWECLRTTFRPGQPGSKESIRTALDQAQLDRRLLDRLEDLRIVKTDEPAKTQMRFELDPLSEYMAALNLVEDLARTTESWRAFFQEADGKPGAPKSIKGFLLAVRDCCEARPGNRIPDSVAIELAKRLSLDADALASSRQHRRIEQLVEHLRSSEFLDREYGEGELLRIGRAAVSALIEVLSDPEPDVRCSAAAILEKIGVDAQAAVPALIEALKDPQTDVRISAGAALGRMGADSHAVVEALTEALKDPEVPVRNSAAWALGRIGPPARASVPALIESLKVSDSSVRSSAAEALTEMGVAAQAAIPALIEGLKDPTLEVRSAAANALGSMGPAALSAVSALIEAHRQLAVRPAVARSLSRIGRPAIPALIGALKDPEADVRCSAAAVLEKMGAHAQAAVPALIEALKDPKASVRSSAAAVLVKVGADAHAAVPALIEALRDPEVDVRGWAASALAGIGPAARVAVPELIELLRDSNSDVRMNSLRALERIGPAAAPALVIATKDSDDWVRDSAATVLRKFQSTAVPAWIEALRDSEAKARSAAASILGEMGTAGEAAVPALLGALRDPEADVRSSAARALGTIGIEGQVVVMALIEVLNDSTAHVRAAAATALGSLGSAPQAAVSALVVSVVDSDASVRESAVSALGRMGPDAQAAVPVLISALRDSEANVRGSAGYALSRVSGSALSTLTKVLKDAALEIRISAAHVIGDMGAAAVAAGPDLGEVLKDPEPEVRAAASEALWRIGPAVVPTLLEALRDPEVETRNAAIDALWKIGPAAVPSLIEVLTDHQADVRKSAADALSKVSVRPTHLFLR